MLKDGLFLGGGGENKLSHNDYISKRQGKVKQLHPNTTILFRGKMSFLRQALNLQHMHSYITFDFILEYACICRHTLHTRDMPPSSPSLAIQRAYRANRERHLSSKQEQSG